MTGKKVALVMSYPYESFSGGDSAYIKGIRNYLLAAGHEVDTLISDVTRGRSSPVLHYEGADQEQGRLSIRRCVRIRRGTYVAMEPLLFADALRRVARRPLVVDERERRGERAWIASSLRKGKYDAVIFLINSYHFADVPSPTPSIALRAMFDNSIFSLGQEVKASIDAATVAEIGKFRLIGINNALEQSYLQERLPDNTVIMVSVGCTVDPVPDELDGLVALFVGADTVPNRASIRWFIDQVWPVIRREVPEVKLHIAGKICGSVEEGAGIVRLGLVDDLPKAYARAHVVVAPLILGSAGVKIKVAEAISYRKPLVTTSLGVDPGDADQFGDAVDVADDAPSFASAVVRLFRDEELRRHRVRQSVDLYERYFSDQAAYGALAAELGL